MVGLGLCRLCVRRLETGQTPAWRRQAPRYLCEATVAAIVDDESVKEVAVALADSVTAAQS